MAIETAIGRMSHSGALVNSMDRNTAVSGMAIDDDRKAADPSAANVPDVAADGRQRPEIEAGRQQTTPCPGPKNES
jgi:hypothetical protein